MLSKTVFISIYKKTQIKLPAGKAPRCLVLLCDYQPVPALTNRDHPQSIDQPELYIIYLAHPLLLTNIKTVEGLPRPVIEPDKHLAGGTIKLQLNRIDIGRILRQLIMHIGYLVSADHAYTLSPSLGVIGLRRGISIG